MVDDRTVEPIWKDGESSLAALFVSDPAGEKTNDSKSADIYSFDEDSGDASSPQQSAPGSTPPASPAQSGGPEAAAAACLPVSSPVQVQTHHEASARQTLRSRASLESIFQLSHVEQ